PEVALFGHGRTSALSPLLGAKRKLDFGTRRSESGPIGAIGFNPCTISLQSTILSFLASAVPRASSCSASSKQSDTKDAQPDRDSQLYQIRSFCSVAPNEKKRAISPGHQLREEQHDRVGNQSPDEP